MGGVTTQDAYVSSLSQTEAQIRAFLAQGEHATAATLLLRTYSDELLGYLVNGLRDRELAREAFALFARDMWLALPKLQLQSSARAWAYALARNASRRLLDRAVRKHRQELPVSQADSAAMGAVETRASTPPYLRTENKTRVAALRERLSFEEQELLTLRIDRAFEWRDIAAVLSPEDEVGSAAARHRKRFQLVKRKLGKLLHAGPEPRPDSSDQNV